MKRSIQLRQWRLPGPFIAGPIGFEAIGVCGGVRAPVPTGLDTIGNSHCAIVFEGEFMVKVGEDFGNGVIFLLLMILNGDGVVALNKKFAALGKPYFQHAGIDDVRQTSLRVEVKGLTICIGRISTAEEVPQPSGEGGKVTNGAYLVLHPCMPHSMSGEGTEVFILEIFDYGSVNFRLT